MTAVFSTLMVSARDLNQENRSLATVCKESCRFCAESAEVRKMAAKGALLELFEKKSLSRNEKYQNVLACPRKHKMGVDSLLRFAKDSLRVEEDILDTVHSVIFVQNFV